MCPLHHDHQINFKIQIKKPGSELFSQEQVQLSSPRECLTSVFGMGTGVSTPLLLPDLFLRSIPQNLMTICRIFVATQSKVGVRSFIILIFDQVLDRLVPFNSAHHCASILGLSTSSYLRGLTSFEWEISSWGGLRA